MTKALARLVVVSCIFFQLPALAQWSLSEKMSRLRWGKSMHEVTQLIPGGETKTILNMTAYLVKDTIQGYPAKTGYLFSHDRKELQMITIFFTPSRANHDTLKSKLQAFLHNQFGGTNTETKKVTNPSQWQNSESVVSLLEVPGSIINLTLIRRPK